MKKRKSSTPARSVAHAADFKKIKRKVGKKAPLKSNVTNTSFATKSIHVPNQKLAVDNTVESRDIHHASSAVTNSRQVNLHDLYGQLKHYSVNVRRDALGGLKDLLQRHPSVITTEASSLLQLIMPCLLDEDRSVRTALIQFLSYLLPTLGASSVAPFQGLLVSYICSGLSHMHYAVKRSAFQTLKLLMELEKTPVGGVKGGSNASASSSSSSVLSFLLWQASHAQILPNLLSCLTERVFVARQANIATTEQLKTGKAAETAHGTNLGNRAAMLLCVEQFLSLCPFAQAVSGPNNATAISLPPCVLHLSALHSLIHLDPSSTTSNSLDPYAALTAAGLDSAALLSSSSARPVPMKYARKSAQQAKFFGTPTAAAAAGSSSSSTPAKPAVGQALTNFIQQLLPLLVEYWLESFGLAAPGPSVGGAAPQKGASLGELLSNLQSILRLLHSCITILRAQRAEKKRNELIESGGMLTSNVNDEDDESLLPSGFPTSLKTHIFASFPFGVSMLGVAGLGANEQNQRALQGLNAECVTLMSLFLAKNAPAVSVSVDQRRKSGNKKQVAEEELLKKIVDYMNESFQSLTAASHAKASRASGAFQTPLVKQDPSADDDEEMKDDIEPSSVLAVDAAALATPRTPSSKRDLSTSAVNTPSRQAIIVENAAVSDLLPLLSTLLPRLPIERQNSLIDSFLAYYLSCHPLSAPKLSCLRFLSDLLAPSQGKEAERVLAKEEIRSGLIEQGEWAGLVGVVAAAVANQLQLDAMKMEDSTSSAETSPVLLRYYEMLQILFQLLIQVGRSYHGYWIDYQLIQLPLLSLFGEIVPAEDGSSHTVNPGPFWNLPIHLQHHGLQLLYYFPSLSASLTQLLLECIRENFGVTSAADAPTILLESKQLVLDMIEERREIVEGGLPAYISFTLGVLRNSRSSNSVSLLLPTVCRMLRSIGNEELASGFPESTDSNALLLQVLEPMLAQCLEQHVTGQAAAAKLNLPTTVLLLESLLEHSMPNLSFPAISALFPRTLWVLLSDSLTAAAVEGGAVHTPANWLSQSSLECLTAGAWLLPMRLLLLVQSVENGRIAKELFQLLSTNIKKGGTQGRDCALQAVVVLAAFVKCKGVHSLLTAHESAVLALANQILKTSPPIASNTLLATLRSELTLLFGQKVQLP